MHVRRIAPKRDNTLQCVAVCCSVLQCVAVCCSVLQCVAVYCSVLQCVAVCCSVLQCVTVCCSVLQCVAVSLSLSFAVSLSPFLSFCLPHLTHTMIQYTLTLDTAGEAPLEPSLSLFLFLSFSLFSLSLAEHTQLIQYILTLDTAGEAPLEPSLSLFLSLFSVPRLTHTTDTVHLNTGCRERNRGSPSRTPYVTLPHRQ